MYVALYRIATHMTHNTIAGWEKAARDIGIIPAIHIFTKLFSVDQSVKNTATGTSEIKLATPNAYVNSQSVTDAIHLTQILNKSLL